MKNHFIIVCMLVVSIAFLACEKEEPPVLTGDIIGTVKLTDGYGFSLQDRSGLQVQLTGDGIDEETTTDAIGRYTFQDIPFGSYIVNLVKENYIPGSMVFRFGHAGGGAATITNQSMNEIPEYRYSIDSLQYDGFNLHFFLTLSETSRTFANSSTCVHAFFSRSPDVSCENYENNLIEWVMLGPETTDKAALYFSFWSGNYKFLEDYDGTVYCRVYPQTAFDEMWYKTDSDPSPCYPETLGKPSEVFSFTVDNITRVFN